MVQILHATDDATIKAYMKLPKIKLAEMLCECNKTLGVPSHTGGWYSCETTVTTSPAPVTKKKGKRNEHCSS